MFKILRFEEKKIKKNNIMNFEKKLEKIRTEINSMSKKVIKLRHEMKTVKKLYLLEKEKSLPEIRNKIKPDTRHQKFAKENFERFAQG
jgi:predicted  nucleic acid-binding Zn-ribbon protein